MACCATRYDHALLHAQEPQSQSPFMSQLHDYNILRAHDPLHVPFYMLSLLHCMQGSTVKPMFDSVVKSMFVCHQGCWATAPDRRVALTPAKCSHIDHNNDRKKLVAVQANTENMQGLQVHISHN